MPKANSSSVKRSRVYSNSDFEKLMAARESWEPRFWPKVNKTSQGCWEWTAGTNDKGYGVFGTYKLGKHKSKLEYSHRISYMISSDKAIPFGMVVDHMCGNPKCLNPDHLQLLRISENSAQGAARLVKNICETCSKPRHVSPSGRTVCRSCTNAYGKKYNLDGRRKLARRAKRLANSGEIEFCGPVLPKGVFRSNKRFRARTTVNYKSLNIGCYDSPNEASIAYMEFNSFRSHRFDLQHNYLGKKH